jgi:hypothetical protein
MYTTEIIMDKYALWFDTGDSLNGSLYLGASDSSVLGSVLLMFRGSNLWSEDTEKQIQTDQKEVYKAELTYVASAEYQITNGEFLLARFDHSKYPSSPERWDSWLSACDAIYNRIQYG